MAGLSKIPSAGFQDNVKFKNILINGGMDIAQRGTSASSISSGATYNTCDRWNFSVNSLGTWTQSQSTDVPSGQGFSSSLKMDCTTADASPSSGDYCIIQQRFEGQNLQYLKKGTSSAEQVTLSFWVKSNKTGTYIAEIIDNDNSRQISKAYTIDSANTWEKKTMTYAGDTSGSLDNDNGHSLDVKFWLGAGSNFTSGTLNTSWNSITPANRAVGQVNLADSTSNEWYITGVQLEAGTTASDFEFLPFDVNYKRCARYYQKSYNVGTAVGTASLTGTFVTGGSAGGATTGYLEGSVSFNNRMRSAPTMVFYDQAGNSNKCTRLLTGTGRTDNQAILSANGNERGLHVFSSGTANASNITIHYTADAEL